MRKALIFTALLLAGSAAQAQTSTTNCTSYIPNNVQCTTTTQQQLSVNWGLLQQQQMQQQQINQQNMNQAFQNLGAAIAADRERRRQRKEAEAAEAQAAGVRAQQEAQRAAQQAQEDSVTKAMQAAISADNAPVPAPPAEKPVLLSCKLGDYSMALALYEKAGRVDVTEAGVTKARAAAFTPDAVSWNGSVWHTALSRIDLSLLSVTRLPELAGAQVTGTCSLAERKF